MESRLLRNTIVAAAAVAIACVPNASTSAGAGSHPDPRGVLANFEGTTINLAKDWGEAHACSITNTGAVCYRTEAEMDAALDDRGQTSSAETNNPATTAATCSTALRLYDGTSFSSTVASFTTRGSLISLASIGFDNRTSSYKVGGCSATLYSGIQTGVYPGNTAANVQATVMLAGWDNAISSVLIP